MWKFFALSVCIPFAVAAQQSEIARRDRAMAQNTAVVSNDTGMVSPGNACGGAVKKAPGRELNIPPPWIGDGEKDREGAAFYAIEFNGRGDIARRIVLHRGFPGWRHMLERGATTLWETWKESDDVYSNCHPMFGSVDEWILKYGRR